MNSALQPKRGHNLRLRVIASTAECEILLKQAHCLCFPQEGSSRENEVVSSE